MSSRGLRKRAASARRRRRLAGAGLADVRFLLSVPGVDGSEVRSYFERAGLLKEFDEIARNS